MIKRTDRELLIECVKQFKHIDEIYDFDPLATTISLMREINQALNLPVVSKLLKIGDTVEIIGNTPSQLKNKPKPLLGKITNIDGAYILVKPKYQRYECEFYSGELRYIC